MKVAHAGIARLTALGMWLTENPRRTVAVFTLLTLIAAALMFSAGLAPHGILVGPNSDGGSGGG